MLNASAKINYATAMEIVCSFVCVCMCECWQRFVIVEYQIYRYTMNTYSFNSHTMVAYNLYMPPRIAYTTHIYLYLWEQSNVE